jgi:predicted amidohydrolase YtcJ
MKTLTLLLALTISLVGCSRDDQPPPETKTKNSQVVDVADVVYTNGRIYTVNESQTWAEAVAIKDGMFLVVGSNDDVKAVTGDSTEVVDLGGKFVMPGIHDLHVHIEQAYIADMLGDALMNFPSEETSIEALQGLLKQHSDKNPDLPVLFAGNLELSLFPNSEPTRAFIDEVVPDRPVVMLSATEHEGLLNSKALEMEGIVADTQTPKGGTIVKDPNTHEPTGLLKEAAAGKWAWKHYPVISAEQNKQGLQGTIAYLNSVGITSIKQQHAKNPVAMAAQSLEQDGNLNARIAFSWTYKGPLEPMPLDEQEKMISERGRFASDLIKTEFVKLSLDGTAGTTGYVVDKYLVTGDRGLPVFPNDEELFAEVEKFDQMGLGITGHATGDAANRQVIDAVENVKKKHGEVKGRHQLGHATLIHPDDIPRLKALDITPEFSPVFWYPSGFPEAQRAQLGEDRMNRWYPMNSVVQSGGRITIASDGPLYWHGPLQIIETAITRQAPGGGGKALVAEEGIDLPTAIKAVTLNSAYLMNQEGTVGSIQKGKRADMVVINKNLFDIPVTEIGSSKVQLTVFEGKVVYDAAKDPSTEEAIEDKYKVELDLSGDAGYRGNFTPRIEK